VHERAEGNPFFTEELFKTLVEQGAVYESGGRWQRKQLSQIEVPHSVRSVVGQRMSRLPTGAPLAFSRLTVRPGLRTGDCW